jgi:periplasmic divalent cation tolerance protein
VKAEMAAKKVSNKTVSEKIVVLVTCGSAKEARSIARSLVERKLAACVNLLPVPVESVYRWKGRIESAKEFLLIVKTARKRFAAVQAEVRRLHSYEVPEIIALPIATGSQDYLAWIADSVANRKP